MGAGAPLEPPTEEEEEEEEEEDPEGAAQTPCPDESFSQTSEPAQL